MIPIQVEISTNEKDGRNATIQLTNIGKSPVTHLDFIVRTPKAIKNYTTLTDVEMNLRKPHPDVLEGHAPKLVQGGGAIILISTSINGNKSFPYNNYSAYAQYDQGSANLTKIDELGDLRSSIWDEIGYHFNIFTVPIKIGIIVAIIVLLSSVLFLTIHKIYNALKKFISDARRKLRTA